MGPHVVPVGDGEANGMLWRLLATRARLDSSELLALILWVEMAYSAEMSARTTAHLPAGLLQTVAPPVATAASTVMSGAPASSSVAPPISSSLPPSLLSLMGGAPPSATNAMTSGASAVTSAAKLTEDSTAHGGMDAGEIATLTFILLTASPPPADHAEIKYGSDLTSTKPYRYLSSAKGGSVGTLLPDLVSPLSTASKEQIHAHMTDAMEACKSIGWDAGAARISDKWHRVSRTFKSSSLIRAYLMEYLRKYRGRGIPVLIDQDAVILCLGAAIGGGEADAAITKLTSKLTEVAAAVADMKQTVNQVKQDLSDFKKATKEKDAGRPKCAYCGAFGHTADKCHKKAADEAPKT